MVSTTGGIVIAIVVLLIAAALGWAVFTHIRARRLGVGPFPFALFVVLCPSFFAK